MTIGLYNPQLNRVVPRSTARTVKVYHTTTEAAARCIERHGFLPSKVALPGLPPFWGVYIARDTPMNLPYVIEVVFEIELDVVGRFQRRSLTIPAEVINAGRIRRLMLNEFPPVLAKVNRGVNALEASLGSGELPHQDPEACPGETCDLQPLHTWKRLADL